MCDQLCFPWPTIQQSHGKILAWVFSRVRSGDKGRATDCRLMISFLAARVFVTTSSEPVVKVLCAAAVAAAEQAVGCDQAAARQVDSQKEDENKHKKSIGGARIVAVNNDRDYCRTGITLVCVANETSGERALISAVRDMARVACDLLDLTKEGDRGHVAHPRLGIVDHVAVHPLPGGSIANLTKAADVATQIARNTSEQCSLPVYLYGAAHPQSKTLPALRRSMGYFQRDQSQNYGPIASSVPGAQGESSQLPSGNPHWPQPDFGPRTPTPTKGVSCIGALDWVLNINMPILTDDMNIAKAIASKVRQLEGVEALPLWHGDACIEIACNVHQSKDTMTSLQLIEGVVSEAARELGVVSVGGAYVVGLDPEDAYKKASASLLGK